MEIFGNQILLNSNIKYYQTTLSISKGMNLLLIWDVHMDKK